MGSSDGLPLPPPLSSLESSGPISLFLDFDGTLVELAPTPDSIHVPGSLPDRLEKLSKKLEGRVAVVSGRSLEDIARHLGSPRVAQAGSHGAARRGADGAWLGEKPQGISGDVASEIAEFASRNGLDYEPKTHGAALHYRSKPEAEDHARAFARALAERHGVAIKTGKCVVELVEPGADKGGAVRAFMEVGPFAGSAPWFVGDDITDEDGFAACAQLGGGGILVGSREDSCAEYSLGSVEEVYRWLDL